MSAWFEYDIEAFWSSIFVSAWLIWVSTFAISGSFEYSTRAPNPVGEEIVNTFKSGSEKFSLSTVVSWVSVIVLLDCNISTFPPVKSTPGAMPGYTNTKKSIGIASSNGISIIFLYRSR